MLRSRKELQLGLLVLASFEQRQLAQDLCLGAYLLNLDCKLLVLTGCPHQAGQLHQLLNSRRLTTQLLCPKTPAPTVRHLTEPYSNLLVASLEALAQANSAKGLGPICIVLPGCYHEAMASLVRLYSERERPLPRLQLVRGRFGGELVGVRQVMLCEEVSVRVQIVIDSGLVTLNKGVRGLPVRQAFPSSQLSSTLRAASSDLCYRLYPEHLQMAATHPPELETAPLGQFILEALFQGVENILDYPCLSHVPQEGLAEGLQLLFDYGLVDDLGRVTQKALVLRELPLSLLRGLLVIHSF